MRWVSFTHVFFDCDGTLTRTEGIVELARMRGQAERVDALTQQAMNGRIPLERIYDRRLALIRPTRKEIFQLVGIYRKNVVPDAPSVIRALQGCGLKVYILSGGLLDAVRRFGHWLGVPSRQIHAVPVRYTPFPGSWWQPGPEGRSTARQAADPFLARQGGKSRLLKGLIRSGWRTLLVGDGATDLEARDVVNLFVAFMGVFHRPPVLDQAPVAILGESLAPVLPLALSPEKAQKLWGTPEELLLRKGLQQARDGALRFQDPKLQDRFFQAWRSWGGKA